MGVFAKTPKVGETLAAGEITLEQVHEVLKKIDITSDGQLDRVEFMLLALNRSLIFS